MRRVYLCCWIVRKGVGPVIQVVVAPVPIVSICVGSLQIVSFLSNPRVTNLLLVRKKREQKTGGMVDDNSKEG